MRRKIMTAFLLWAVLALLLCAGGKRSRKN